MQKENKSNLKEDEIASIILKILTVDTRPVPFNVLKSKFFRFIRANHPTEFVSEEIFFNILTSLKKKYLIGENQYGKWFIDYLDYKKSDRFGEGFLDIEEKSGNGFITIKKEGEKYKKSSHFVHKKNLNGAKKGDFVKFVELEIIPRKRNASKFSLIDASIVEILKSSEVVI
ncbi:ribonuclease R [Mycoplasma parvum str. Indiana]|uniref:Ribonuclease R n=1 Tax=Mycoplasma parvum str. Indiana TaxID=1403316 RepID=U5NFY9_9MOLU|nr:ribonuclease R [Mycoplasma parvum str. Indiana]